MENRKPTLETKSLEWDVSQDANFIEWMAMKRASKDVELIHLLPRIRDP